MTLQSSGAISLNQIAAEFGGTAPHSMSEYLKGGDNVPATLTSSATQAAPSSNGTYNDFGGVTGLTLVRTTPQTTTYDPGPSSSQYNTLSWTSSSSTGSQGSSSSYRLQYGARGYQEGGTLTVTYPSGTVTQTYHTGGTLSPNHTLFQNGPYTISTNNNATISWRIFNFTYPATYTFTNNTGYDATIESTTIGNTSSQAVSPTGDFNTSYTIAVNTNVPTSGKLALTNFYNGRKT